MFNMTDDARYKRTVAVVEGIRNGLEELAPDTDYRNSISSRVYSATEGEVSLKPPGLLREHDKAVRDVRNDVLKSAKAKTSATGSRYLSVPMKDGFRTASSAGKPWFTKGRPGIGGIVKVRARFKDFLVAAWGAA